MGSKTSPTFSPKGKFFSDLLVKISSKIFALTNYLLVKPLRHSRQKENFFSDLLVKISSKIFALTNDLLVKPRRRSRQKGQKIFQKNKKFSKKLKKFLKFYFFSQNF